MFYNASTAGGAWANQMLSLSPKPGSINVPRNMAIWIDEPRPVTVKNVSLSPEVLIAKRTDQHYMPASADITVYPKGLLQPNTTYNVTAIVAGTSSWWIFTTSSKPDQVAFGAKLSPYNVWLALAVAVIAELIAIKVIVRKRKLNLTP